LIEIRGVVEIEQAIYSRFGDPHAPCKGSALDARDLRNAK